MIINNWVLGNRSILLLSLMLFAACGYWFAPDRSNRKTPGVSILQVVQPPDDLFFKEPIPIPEFPAELDWINTNSKLKLSDLRGKLVLLDFWTYCCINCMHILPVLDEVEKRYDKQLVVVGVHTAKFETEKDTENIREAIERYEIRHPVLNDSNHLLWNQLRIGSWPTLVLIDPQGRAIWANAGEIDLESLDRVIQKAIAYYESRKELDLRNVHFDLELNAVKDTPLRYPGKILADEMGQRLFIADSNHNRIVVTDLSGRYLETIGSGVDGSKDGSFAEAQFNHPQGMAVHGSHLFVADTQNHLIRSVDWKTKQVKTVAGTGKQAREAFFSENPNKTMSQRPTRAPLQAELASPWDLLIHGDKLYIAMAGPHQIWTMDLEGSEIGPFAGNGREDIVDGPLLPKKPYELGASSFAQPSGLATDGKRLFVADSEGSSIRALPLDSRGTVSTVVGTSKLKRNRLFVFGDTDGPIGTARFQHPLAVAYQDEKIFVADTYNSKIRQIDLKSKTVSTLAGASRSGEVALDEPAGLSLMGDQLYIADTNQHRIRILDLKTNELRTLEIEGLKPLSETKPRRAVQLPRGGREQQLESVTLESSQTSMIIPVEYLLPVGWKLNADAPLGYVAIWKDGTGATIADASAAGTFADPGTSVTLELKVPEGNPLTLQVGLTYYFCRADGTGLCLADSSIFSFPITRGAQASKASIEVEVEPKK